MSFDRRLLLKSLSGAAVAASAIALSPLSVLGRSAFKEVHHLKPGEFTWTPDLSPIGPVAIIVSIPDQLVHVYRNGIRIGISTCSTGKPGHATPHGVFTILEKDKHHRSSTYNNAPMPNMNRLTWGGVALHAGNLPGYPASHGCIRLPLKFSELLFSVTHVGTAVILADNASEPTEVTHPGLVLSDYATHEFTSVEKKLKGSPLPWHADVVKADTVPAAVIVSHADMSVTVLENGKPVAHGRANIDNPQQPLGRHVFILTGLHDGRQGLAWHAFSHHSEKGATIAQPEEAVLRRIKADDDVLRAIQERMHPGLILVTTELPAHPDTRTGDDFVLMDAHVS